jgi:NitT/TauT family transport system substrate-binding protein
MRLTTLMGAALTALVGLGGGDASALNKLRLGDTSPSAPSLPVMIAIDHGFYAAENLEVEITYTGNNTTVAQQLIGRNFDLGLTTFETAIRAIDKGAPVQITGSVMLKYAYSMMADKSINSISQMKGKRVMLALPKSALTVYWNRALEKAGMKINDVEQIYDGSTVNRFAALSSGSVQAAALNQPLDFLAQDKGYNKIVDITDFARGFGFTAVIGARNWLEQHADETKAFYRATKKGVSFFYDPAKKDAVIATLIKHTKIDAASAERTYLYYRDELKPYDPNLSADDSTIRTVVNLINEVEGSSIDANNPRKFVTQAFLPN